MTTGARDAARSPVTRYHVSKPRNGATPSMTCMVFSWKGGLRAADPGRVPSGAVPGHPRQTGRQNPDGLLAKLRGAALITVAVPFATWNTARPRSFGPSARKRNRPSAPLKPEVLVRASDEKCGEDG